MHIDFLKLIYLTPPQPYRLSQGHAKLLFRKEVIVRDAISTVYLMDQSLKSGKSTRNIIHSLAPPDDEAEGQYEEIGIMQFPFFYD